MARIELDVTAVIPDGFIVSKAVVVIEGFSEEDDGGLTLWTTTSPDVKGWQTLGMLEAFVAIEKASLVSQFVEQDDE